MLIISLISLLFVQILGVMLPGPDFFMVLRSSLKYGRSSATLVAAGIASGILLYAAVVLTLLDFLQNNFLMIVHWITLFGGCYLLYIAFKCFKASSGKHQLQETNTHITQASSKHLYLSGLLCNLSNPKVIVFFLSILPIFAIKSSALWYQSSILIIMFATTFIWFTFVGFIMGSQQVRKVFVHHMPKLEIIFACILSFFAILLIYAFFTGDII